MPRPKGLPKTGGRKKGTPNKATLDVKHRIDQILDNESGWQHIADQFAQGELPIPVLLRLIEYRIGKPKESIEMSGPDGGPMEHVAKLSSHLLRQIQKELKGGAEHE